MEQDLASEPSYGSRQKKGVAVWKVLTVAFALLFIAAVFTKGFTLLNITGKAVLNQDEAKVKADDFIQKYLVLPGVTVNINDISEESGLYRLDLTATSQDVNQDAQAYITKDGKYFFLQAIPLDEVNDLLQQQDTVDLGTETLPADIPEVIPLTKDDDPVLGINGQGVKLTLFTEFQCPDCEEFARDALPIIKKEYLDTGMAYLVLKDFPQESLHKRSFDAALAANCALEQDKYWQYHDLLFANTKELESNFLKRRAVDLKLDTGSFNNCLESRNYESEIQQDIEEGKQFNIRTTPTIMVNNRVIVYKNIDTLQKVINEELAAF